MSPIVKLASGVSNILLLYAAYTNQEPHLQAPLKWSVYFLIFALFITFSDLEKSLARVKKNCFQNPIELGLFVTFGVLVVLCTIGFELWRFYQTITFIHQNVPMSFGLGVFMCSNILSIIVILSPKH